MAMIGRRKEAAITGKYDRPALWIHRANAMLENILENVPALTNRDHHTSPALRKT